MSHHAPEIYEAEFRTYGPQISVSRVGVACFFERAPVGLRPDCAYAAELIPVNRLGVLVKERRGNMTQRDLAAVTRIKQPTISDIERGTAPSVAIANRLYSALGGTCLYLAVADVAEADKPHNLSVIGTQDYGGAAGVLLREAREERGVTQRGLAELTGKSQPQISAVEGAWYDGGSFTTRIGNLPQYFEPLEFWVGYCGIKDRATSG